MPYKIQRNAPVHDATDPIRRTIDVLNDDIQKLIVRRDELLAQLDDHQQRDEKLIAEAEEERQKKQPKRRRNVKASA